MPTLAEILAQVPPTDEEAKNPQAARLHPSKFTGPKWEDAGRWCEDLLRDGAALVRELIAGLRDPAAEDFPGYRGEYLLHILTTYTGSADRDAKRRAVAKVLTEELGQAARSDYVRAFLIRELQWIGDKDNLPALANCLASDALCQPAVTAMLAIGEGAEDPLRKALPAAAGPRRLAVLHGLADLADAQSADAFLKALEDPDESIRLSAAWGLSQLADPAAIDPLLKATERPAPASYERTKMLSAGIQMAERLAKAGKKKDAAKIFRHLTEKCTREKEDYLRELATRALAELG